MKTFEKDILGRECFAKQIETYLEESFSSDSSLVISINGPFGSGKSDFIDRWRNRIQSTNQGNYKAILINAWESDFCDDPLLPLLSEVIEKLQGITEENSNKAGENENIKNLKEKGAKVLQFSLLLANSLFSNKTGVNIREILNEMASEDTGKLLDEGKIFELYQERKSAISELKLLIKESLEKAGGKKGKKLIIFIDELDRCRPDYAVSFLETLKHIFDIPGLIFVITIDYLHLENSCKALFGKDLVFPEYFRKFVQRSFTLPTYDREALFKFLKCIVKESFSTAENVGTRVNFTHSVDRIILLITAFELTARQIIEFTKALAHFFRCEKGTLKEAPVQYLIACCFMIILKMKDPKQYSAFGRGVVPDMEYCRDLNAKLKNFRGECFSLIVEGFDSEELLKGLEEEELLDLTQIQKRKSARDSTLDAHEQNQIGRIYTVFESGQRATY